MISLSSLSLSLSLSQYKVICCYTFRGYSWGFSRDRDHHDHEILRGDILAECNTV